MTIEITADNLTDEQIRSVDPYDLPSDARADALRMQRGPYDNGPLTQDDVRAARARISDIINARAKAVR